MKIEILPDADAVAREGVRNSSPQRLERLSRRAAVLSWPSAAATRRGKCCVP